MGLFSKLAGAATFGLVGDDPFEFARTGATGAARDAEKLGFEQLALEREFGEELQGITKPGIGMGQEATQSLYDYYSGDPAAQNQFISGVSAIALYLLEWKSKALKEFARYAGATGGFRGGDTQQNLAVNSQNVLNSLLQQKLQGLEGISDYGLQSQNIYTGGRGGKYRTDGPNSRRHC